MGGRFRIKQKMPPKGGIAAIEEAGRLDAYTKLTSLLLAGVGVEVIGVRFLNFARLRNSAPR